VGPDVDGGGGGDADRSAGSGDPGRPAGRPLTCCWCSSASSLGPMVGTDRV